MLTIHPNELGLGEDYDPNELQGLIDTTVARASIIAPCLTGPALTGLYETAAKGVLIGVLVRRARLEKDGLVPGVSGAVTAGGRTESTDTRDLKVLLWPHEIAELQSICAAATSAAVAAPVHSFPDPAGRFPDPAEREPRFPRW